jgi:acyl-CoA thioesterase
MVRVVVAATYGDLDAAAGPTSIQAERPEFPPPEDCIRAAGPNAPPFMQQFDLRLTPETASWAMTKPSGVAEAAGWIRFADGREPDPTCLPLMSDAFPPTVFNVLPSLWVPTIQLTVHVRGRPRPGWLQARFRTRYLIDGHLEEDGEIWDSSGRLVALSRQLARVL